MFCSFIFLGCGWVGILALAIYENNMQEYISQYNSFLGSWVPTALVTIINLVVPAILARITEFEEWDFAATQFKHEVWRTYLAGILNNLIFALIYAEVLID